MIARLPGIQSYWLMLVATVITVSIVTASQLITLRISLLLDRQASELLAADVVVVSSQGFVEAYEQKAREIGLQVAKTASFASAIFIDDSPQMVEVKAVESAYPLRGKLEKAQDVTGAKTSVLQGPEAGEVWLDPKLAQILGSDIDLGSQKFLASWLLTFEPDRGGALFNIAPRVLMNIDDLAATGLIMPGSRVQYRLLLAGDQAQIEAYTRWISENLSSDDSVQDLQNARPEMRRALDRTRKFFALSVVLTLVIAMVAIAITARYTASREAPKVAVLRAFGISRMKLLSFYSGQIGKLWIIATLFGVGLGWFSQYPLEWALGDWFGRELPQTHSILPYTNAAIIGFVSLAGFCLPYLAIVTATPPMQVFRHVSSRQSLQRNLLVMGSAIVTVFLVLVILVQNSQLAIVTLALVLAAALLLPGVFRLMIYLLLFSSKPKFWLRQYLLSRLKSNTRGALAVMSGFSLALLAILMIAVVKDELLASWQTQLPEDIPNYFLINLPGNEVPDIQQFLTQNKIPTSTAYPLVRARMTHINAAVVQTIEFADPRGAHLVEHTFNISYADKIPDDNRVVDGEWMAVDDDSAQFSVEKGMADTLNLRVGDMLSFSVGSELMKAPVTSIRTVEWENFKPNFYLLANQHLIEDLPQTWIMGALVTGEHEQTLKQLLKRFPSTTLLDISQLMARIRGIIERASIALEFFFIFALVAAFIVLLAAIQTGKNERQMESSLLRALSASTSQLYRVHVLEFTLMGLLIGFFAALFSSFAAWVISVYFFEIDYHFSIQIWGYGLLSATLILTIAGTLVSRKVYNISPMKMLRS